MCYLFYLLKFCSDNENAFKRKLVERYGSEIVISALTGRGKPAVICFRNAGNVILQHDWETEKSVSDENDLE